MEEGKPMTQEEYVKACLERYRPYVLIADGLVR